jgi:hypothetical protein
MIKLKRGIFASANKLISKISWLFGNSSGKLYTSTNGVTWVTSSLVPTGNFTDNINTGITWTTVNSTFGGTIRTVGYGNDLWVISGDAGYSHVSTDTVSWVSKDTSFAGNIIRSIAYGNGLWVAVGHQSFISTSTNALTWITQNSNSGTTTIFSSISYGNGIWLAGADIGKLRSSTNGITWSTINSSFATTALSSIYANNLWVIVGQNGELSTSTNYVNWTTRTSTFGTSNITSIAYGNGLFVTAGQSGQLRYSTNAINWITGNPNFGSSTITSVAYANNLWIAVGVTGQTTTSTDVITWISKNSNFGATLIKQVLYGNNLWMMVGDSSQIRTSPQIYKSATASIQDLEYNPNSTNAVFWLAGTGGALYSSTDSILWTTNNSPTTFNNRDINAIEYAVDNGQGNLSWNTVANTSGLGPSFMSYGNGAWVFGGIANAARASTDLISWVTINLSFGTSPSSAALYNNGLWVFGGNAGKISTATTTDNISWSITTRTSLFNTSTDVKKIAYGNGTWVVCANTSSTQTGIRFSTDNGISWATGNSFGSTFNSIAYANSLFVAVGNQGVIRQSNDGQTWTTVNSTYSLTAGVHNLNTITYAKNKWVIAGTSPSSIKYSYDLITWVTGNLNGPMPGSAIDYVNLISYDNAIYLSNTNGAIFSSTDALTWVTAYRSSAGGASLGAGTETDSTASLAYIIGAELLKKVNYKSYMIGLNNNG